ncbi:TLC domain-containing protein [Fragilaria crotonensis]|nr:TLC domain-containing protein [Fragilaria crotonensis]
MSTILYIIKSILNDPVIIPLGSSILAIHIVLFFLFKYVCPDGPWKVLPSFTAHQVIALVLMIYQTYLGFMYHRDGGMMNVNQPGVFMARFSVASMMIWDIPVGVVSDGMGDLIMHVHHVGTFIVSAIALGLFSNGTPIGSAYVPFFLGIVELSSIPLAIVDVFHPKQKAWHAYLATSKSLQTINEISRVLFALLYVATRVLYFPYVMFTGVLPDCLSAANDHPEFVSPLYTVMLLGILFTMLQWYWGKLVIQQIIKALGGDAKTKKAK